MTQLPLPITAYRATHPALCACGAPAGLKSAPGELVGEVGAWRHEPGPRQCDPCSRETWAAYLHAARERRALITVSRWLGYPARRSDVERLRRAGEQVALGVS